MLLNLTVENWKSFRDPVFFSMIKTRERQHSVRVPWVESYDVGILPTAAIYGGNASGKTNLFSALSFVKKFVVRQRAPDEGTGVTPFLLEDDARTGLTKFSVRVLTSNDVAYELSFSLDEKRVDEEKLIKVEGGHEQILYHRKAGRKDPALNLSLGDDRKRLKFIFEGTQDNQLFMANSIYQKCDAFRPVYDWFARTLILIGPTARYLAPEKYVTDARMAEMLRQLDTGVVELGSNDAAIGDLNLPGQTMELLRKDLLGEKTAATLENSSGSRFMFTKAADGGVLVKELVTRHQKVDSKPMDFHLSQESDGTRRLMDLLPAFLDMSSPSSRRVYVVDELDRSLHTLLTRSLIEYYLGCCSASSRSQFIFTTHDALLMDQRLLRRDEIWVTERKGDGSSDLFSFSEYKDARKDKDIRKSYLQGRLGGVPRIFLEDTFCSSSPDRSDETKGGSK